jgi:tRNA nucleotidyltransferase (CCA-adding enzyme)
MNTSAPAYRLCEFIAQKVRLKGGRALLVGGCVRDDLLGIEPKDYDLEVFGITVDALPAILAECGTVLQVGRSFPVWKVWTDEMGQGSAVDVALPRREVKVGEKHTDFEVVLDPHMTFEEAAARRDFTINAMGLDPISGELLDPHGGRDDLERRILRHVSYHFAEDPLRVMRGAQFCARFNLRPSVTTIWKCRDLTPEHLSAERLWEEWCKLILKGQVISRGLQFLDDCNWIEHFPEVAALRGVPQNAAWHPEGDVWVHTLHCMDAFARTRTGDDREDLIVGLAALCHDFGKPSTTAQDEQGRWIAHGHEEAGEAPTWSFLGRLTNEQGFVEDVVSLVVHHMTARSLYKEATRGETVKMMNRSVRRLAQKVNLRRLARVMWIDKAGRPPLPPDDAAAEWLKERAAALDVLAQKPKPLLMGRHLIDLGMKPGVEFKAILSGAFERQLDGDITTLEEAVQYAREQIKS